MDEARFRSLISGQTRGVPAAILRAALHGLSLPYSAAVRARNAAYDTRIKRSHTPPVPVISVGNITAGGTGKTPVVAYLSRWFSERQIRVVLLSRGYRSLNGEENDEKRVLDRLCPGVPHIQHRDRVASAARAINECDARLLILDDGFQHRRLARTLDIVLIDVSCPFGYGSLLPRGLLREPVSSLRRADLVVLTRVGQCDELALKSLRDTITRVRHNDRIVETCFAPAGLVNASRQTTGLDDMRERRIAAFCGIGNPQAFQQTLASARLELVAFHAFPDHHHYGEADLDQLVDMSARSGADALVTTLKDLVKINHDRLGDYSLWAAGIETQIVSGDVYLQDELDQVLRGVN